MGCLGRETCTVQSISAQTHQEGIKCTKSKEWLRSYYLIYISTVLQKQFGTPILLGKIAFPVAQDIPFYDQAFAIHIVIKVLTPPIYFDILHFEISSLTNWVFS